MRACDNETSSSGINWGRQCVPAKSAGQSWSYVVLSAAGQCGGLSWGSGCASVELELHGELNGLS